MPVTQERIEALKTIIATEQERAKKTRRHQWSDLLDTLDPLPSEPEPESNGKTKTSTAHLAGTRFNERANHRRILERWGRCTLVRTDRSSGDEHWVYVNAENDTSATWYKDERHIAVWSETMARELGLEVRRPYDLFGFWTFTRHKGDFDVAHAKLEELGIFDLTSTALSPNGRTSTKGPRPLTVVEGTDVKRVPLIWTWPNWLPRRKLIMLDGDPDVGKSTLSLDIAARITRGWDMPDGSPGINGGADVVLLSAEDDIDDTIAWRLDIAGADQSKIHYVTAAQDPDGETPVTIPQDVESLEGVIRRYNAALVVVDVLAEFLDTSVDSHNDHKIRRVLRPVRQMASRTTTSVLTLRHLRKAGSDKAIYRGGGSIGIIGAARAGWVVSRHPDDMNLRVLAALKMNLGLAPKSLGFRLIPHEQYPDYAYVKWEKDSLDITAEQLLSLPERATEEQTDDRNRTEQCMDSLRQILMEPGDHWTNDVLDELRREKYKDRTIDNARARLGVISKRRKRPDGVWGWKMYLPEQLPPEP